MASGYRGNDANAAFHCGFPAWQLQPDRTFRIVREEDAARAREEIQRTPGVDLIAPFGRLLPLHPAVL